MIMPAYSQKVAAVIMFDSSSSNNDDNRDINNDEIKIKSLRNKNNDRINDNDNDNDNAGCLSKLLCSFDHACCLSMA